MKVEHALRDLYDHERTMHVLAGLEFMLLAVIYIAVAIEAWAVYAAAFIAMVLLMSMGFGTLADGYNRRLWSAVPGLLDGVPLKTKRNALKAYRITDESDLEDLEE